MTLLQALRQSRLVARFALVWFVLSMAVAVAAPVVQPQASMLVCSASGSLVLADSGSDEGVVASSHTLNCVMCLSLYATPPAPVDLAGLPRAAAVHGPSHALVPVVPRSDARLAARAPPALI